MKRTTLCIFLISCSLILFATDYSKVDSHSGSVPQNMRTAPEIARYLTKDLASPTDKVRAIYYWMAHSIRYDVSKMNSNSTYTDPQELVDQVLKTRKGLCAHYSALFDACCHSVGIQSYNIEGYTRQNGKVINIAHAWNAVKIDGRFYNIDVTWAAGYITGSKYLHKFTDEFFMIPPVEFIKTHMPFDPVWQFSNHPITHKEFDTSDFSTQKKGSGFNFSDSIKEQSGLSMLEKMIHENQRITTSGVTNGMTRNKISQNQQGIATEKYNHAAEAFNKGVQKFNYYVQCKNSQFEKTTLKDDKILEVLSSARRLIESAESTLTTMKTDKSDKIRSTGDLEKSIRVLKKELDTEDAFVGKYIKTSKSLRLNLFYRKIG